MMISRGFSEIWKSMVRGSQSSLQKVGQFLQLKYIFLLRCLFHLLLSQFLPPPPLSHPLPSFTPPSLPLLSLLLLYSGPVSVKSKDIQVSDIVVLEKDQRVPADMILLRTTERSGSCFIRTDQLDGETDWKLRMAVPSTQALASEQVHVHVHVYIRTCTLYMCNVLVLGAYMYMYMYNVTRPYMCVVLFLGVHHKTCTCIHIHHLTCIYTMYMYMYMLFLRLFV